MATTNSSSPLHLRVGMLATVRNRRGLIVSVETYPGNPDGDLHLVRIEYTDPDGVPAYALRDDPKHDYAARLGKLGFDKACIASMCKSPTLYESNEDARAHGVDPLALPAKTAPGAKAPPR